MAPRLLPSTAWSRAHASEYFNEENTHPSSRLWALGNGRLAQTTRTPPTPQSAPARTGAQPPSAQEFVNKVAISDMFEIQSSQLALSKEPDSDTKPFARRMVADHQKTSSELKSLVDGGKVKATLPTAMDSDHQGMFDQLRGKSGKDFDQSYDQTQLKAHQDAVVLFEAYSRAGDDA
jgi:putative membrane protein